MSTSEIKARLSDEARAWTEREDRKRIADESFRRAQRHDRNVKALILGGLVTMLASLLGLAYLGVK